MYKLPKNSTKSTKSIASITSVVLCVLILLCLLCQFVLAAESTITDKTDIKDIKDERKTVSLPVIMYHDIIKNTVRHDIYTITPWDFEEDLKWLKNNGYQTVSINEIIDYVENGAVLPEKPIMLTFDDGHYNNIIYAEPILEKYGMKGIIFITGEFCDKSVEEDAKNPNYSYIFWDEQRRMIESGIWDIENHTYCLHRTGNGRNGVAKLWNENNDAYHVRLSDDFQRLTDKIYDSCGVRPRAFAYPFGVLSDTAEEVLGELDYKASFTSYSGTTELKVGAPESLRLIHRYLRTPKNSVQDLLNLQ